MANPKHLAILKQGVQAWNVWRKHNPRARPHLEGADLRDLRLDDIHLSDSNPIGAHLQRPRQLSEGV
jgi:hypothetical protein